MALDLAQLWNDLPLVVLDTETTGVDTKRAGIVQVAAVRFEQGRVVDRFCALAKPPHPIPASAAAIHGITDAMVADAPPVTEHGPALARLCAGALPVAYNAGFDRRMLHRFFTGPEVPAWSMPVWVCPLIILRDVERVVEGKGYYRLENACARWEVPLEKAHDASADAEAAGRLLWRLFELGKVRSCPAWRLLQHLDRRTSAQENYRTW